MRNGQFKLIQFDDGREEFYDLLADPYEATNLLNGSVTATQQANYYSLTLRLAGYQRALAQPVITGSSKTNNAFTVTVQRDTNLVYSLWRSLDFGELGWSPVTNAVAVTNSPTQVTLTDTNASDGQQFYRVVGTAP